MQDANVWLFPGGNDGSGNAHAGTTQNPAWFWRWKRRDAVSTRSRSGNSHGDNHPRRLRAPPTPLHGFASFTPKPMAAHPKSTSSPGAKASLVVDAYLANAATGFRAFRAGFFDRVAAAQSEAVPAFRSDVRVYVALSGPHQGIDLELPPPDPHVDHRQHIVECAGRTRTHAVDVVSAPSASTGAPTPWYSNPYAKSVCESRGGTWLDFFNRIYVSNVSSLDSDGKPVSRGSLRSLNPTDGIIASHRLTSTTPAVWQRHEPGKWVSAYLSGCRRRFRAATTRLRVATCDWKDLDADETATTAAAAC